MPVYEYRCRACGHEFEHLVLPGRTMPVPCPACGAEDVERLLSAFAVSSGAISRKNLQAARGRHARSANRRDKGVAEYQYVRDHMADEGIAIPPVASSKKPAS